MELKLFFKQLHEGLNTLNRVQGVGKKKAKEETEVPT